MTPGEPSALRRFGSVLAAQGAVLGAVYAVSVAAFAAVSRTLTDRFAALAAGPYLGAVVRAQLRVLPAYAVVALCAALLSYPLLSRVGATRLPWRALAWRVLGLDLVLLVLSLGPLVRARPALLDLIARKVAPVAPRLDLYVLFRWHLLDGAAVVFGLVCLAAAAHCALALRPVTRGKSRWLALVGVGALVSMGALAVRQQPSARPPRNSGPPNVLIVASDSLRFDRLGVHGAEHADITPHLDAFARQAIDLGNLHVASPSTLESWLTFFSGRFPPTHGVRALYVDRAQAQAVAEDPNLLPRLLERAGYDTIVSSDWAGNCFGLVDVGFSRNRAPRSQSFTALIDEATFLSHTLVPLYFSNRAGEWLLPEGSVLAATAGPRQLTDRLLDEVDASVARGRPFFALLFTSATHLPYNASYPYNIRYVDPAYDGPHRYQIDVQVHELIASGFSPTLAPATIRHVRDLYDGAVAEFDDTVGRVLAELDARGLADDTVVIVTSDHGEDLYDPGSTLGHGTNFFGGDQATRIPFLIRVPGPSGPLRPGARVDAIARNADLAPTLLALLGRPAPASMEGQSLLPLLTGSVADLDLPAFSEASYLFFPKSKAMTVLSARERDELLEVPGADQTLDVDPTFDDNLVLRPSLRAAVVAAKDRMVRTRRWKLVEIPGRRGPITRLFDLDADPHQTTDVSAREPEVREELHALLARYWGGEGASLRWPEHLERR